MYQVITLIEGAFHVLASSNDLNVAESILKFYKLADNENAYAIYDMKNSDIRNYELEESDH